jgi:hypothetical protein
MKDYDRLKWASFLGNLMGNRQQDPSAMDYARIAGRTGLEGGLGGAAGLVGGAAAADPLWNLLNKVKGTTPARLPMGKSVFGGPKGKFGLWSMLLGLAGGGLAGAAHGFGAAKSNMRDRLKMASFLSGDPSAMDYGRVGGRTALEGGIGALGGANLAALLGLLMMKKMPNVSEGTTSLIRALPGIGAGVGGLAGGSHGYHAALENMRERLGPISRLKRLFS